MGDNHFAATYVGLTLELHDGRIVRDVQTLGKLPSLSTAESET
jgi:hypothetical protein